MILPALKLIGIILLPFFIYFSLKRLREIRDLLVEILTKLNTIDPDKKTTQKKEE